jgi:hypothetical protein
MRSFTSLRSSLVAVGLACLLGGCSSTLNSTTWIPPGDAFELGGGNVGAFRVTGTNTGPTRVEVLAVRLNQPMTIATVPPGGSVDHEFSDGDLAKFRNLSSKDRAELTIVVRGAIGNLGMTYEGNNKPKAK